jgi:hypothetical protein
MIASKDDRPMLNLPAQAIYCLKIGARPGRRVDQAQEESPEERDEARRKDSLYCAKCHYPITRQSDRIGVNEKHQHVFANPHGYIYRIGCFGQAPGCVAVGGESSEFTWFPGYSWRVVVCGQCLTLLGWSFRSQESLFFGLIVDKLAEDVVD